MTEREAGRREACEEIKRLIDRVLQLGSHHPVTDYRLGALIASGEIYWLVDSVEKRDA